MIESAPLAAPIMRSVMLLNDDFMFNIYNLEQVTENCNLCNALILWERVQKETSLAGVIQG
jgi:hypothetical protein